jgi:oxygen-independent coproporphyrinogen-3 oxidase
MALMLKAIKRFTDAGYQFIGLDHFAKPNDPLAVAASKGELGRTFQGMTKGRGHITVGVGPSAISTFADGFSQNDRQYAGWTKAVQAHGLATTRGFKLTADDRVRGAALADLYGKGSIDFHQFELRHWVKFRDYFATHLPALTRLAADDIIEINESGLKLTPVLGRLLTRVVASVLDSYLPEDAWRRGLATGGSKVG